MALDPRAVRATPGWTPIVLVSEAGLSDAGEIVDALDDLDVRPLRTKTVQEAAEWLSSGEVTLWVVASEAVVEVAAVLETLDDGTSPLVLCLGVPPNGAVPAWPFDVLLRPFDPDLLRRRVATLVAVQARARRDAQRCEALERGLRRTRQRAKEAERDAHERQRQLLRRVAAADRQRDELLAILAHELRNPLAPVVTGLELIRAHTGGQPELDHARAAMERQVHHLVRLVDDLLDASRISRGKVSLRRDWIDLREVIRHAIAPWSEELRNRRHELTLELPERPASCHGDRVRLTQLVDNLLANAIRHTHTDAHIHVRLTLHQDELVLQVSDDGPGIPPDLGDRVFEMFVQGSRGNGLGLGLALVRQIASLHGGSASLHGAEDEGATFDVRLPLRLAAEPETAGPCCTLAEARALHVVLVEDDPDVRETTRLLLEAWGHAVEVAATGLDGVDTVLQARPDVVLLDLGLPDIDGHTAARRIRDLMGSRHPHLVALTGFGQDDDRRRSRDAGFDAHLLKPVSPATLRRTLASIVRQP